MLPIFPVRSSDCEASSRRQFLLEVGSLTGVGLSLDVLLRQRAARAEEAKSSNRDVNCILIWTQGGTSHHDTLDPKPQATVDVRGEFGVIDTALPGIQFSDQMPRFAQSLGQYALVRRLNPQNGSHGVADANMMSGHKFNPSLRYPCFGSVVAKEKGFRNQMPPFAQLGGYLDRRYGGGMPGYLGIGYNAFEVPGDPSGSNFSVRDVSPSEGISLPRIERRRDAQQALDQFQRQLDAPPASLVAMDEYYHSAFSMITSPATRGAFQLEAESAATRDAYGRNRLGQSCLLARRLIEAGTRFVTVTSGGWDTHENNFGRLRTLLPPLDQAFPALISDLADRGLLDSTLVVWMTDFGRTPLINSSAGRDHWVTASMVCMAGAGTPGGTVVGRTDDQGARPVDGEVYPRDIAATIYTKLGIPLDTWHTTPDGRPMLLCEGRPIPELMS